VAAKETIGRYYRVDDERMITMSRYFRMCIIAVVLLAFGAPLAPRADVNISVGVGVPPPLTIPSPPSVFLIPGTYAYFVPDLDVDILFYRGYWYRPHGGHWYRATRYNGPWTYIVKPKVPRVLIDLSPDFHHVPPGHQRIPYGQLKKHWKTWEKEKHWDKHEEKEYHYKEAKREHEEHGKGKGKGKGKHKDD
jgi:hypothetical protein